MKIKQIYVLNANGEPLMPTQRLGKVRHWLQSGQAHWYGNRRNTIQFVRPVGSITQDCVEGIDAGMHLGISVVCPSTNQELYAGLSQRDYKQEVQRNKARLMYRRARRNRLRHRKARFNNRRKSQNWLAPSIQHYLDFALNEINRIQTFLPITRIIVEDAPFDVTTLTNHGQRPIDYTKGRLHGFKTVKDYLYVEQNGIDPLDGQHYQLHEMVIHHLLSRSQGGTNNPDNLILLARKNHTGANHNNGILNDLAKARTFAINSKGAYLMNVLHVRLPQLITNKPLIFTYGYKTAQKRKALSITKNHQNEFNHIQDAMLIAGGDNYTKHLSNLYFRYKHHRNNRSLSKFYDATYIDKRDGKKKKGKALGSGRTNRKDQDFENLRQFRSHKVKAGRFSTRKKHYPFQPHDLIMYQDQIYICRGSQNKGKYIGFIKSKEQNKKIVKSVKQVQLIYHANQLETYNQAYPI